MSTGGDTNAARRRLAAHLSGAGVEIGPGQYPFRLLPPGVEVRYVDRWDAGDRQALVSELHGTTTEPGGVAHYVAPDVVADFNTDRLRALGDASQDFVIASHVLEHLAEPIGFVAEIHRVLRPGGTALVLLPDRHRTEDRFRAATPLEHLVAEYRHGVQEVSDAHLVEFLRDRGTPLRGSAEARRRTLDTHRRQSIHVHCWDASEFLPVVLWGIEHLGEQWEFVDGTLYEPPIHYEFGYVLRRSVVALDPAERRREFEAHWRAWFDDQVRARPGIAVPPGHGRLPPGLARRARGVVRRHRWAAWAYRRVGRAAGRRRGGAGVATARPPQGGGPR